MTDLQELAALSRRYGADPRFVLLGGGNTSWKSADTLYIKPSGVALADIQPAHFVAMDRALIRQVFSATSPSDCWEREAWIKDRMAAAVRPRSQGRPSVEAPLHELLDTRFVVHLHPPAVNGMTCARQGAAACQRLFPEALWVEYVDPGYTLASVIAQRLRQWGATGKPQPRLIFLQNHGVFVGGDNLAEIESAYARIMGALEQAYRAAGIAMELPVAEYDTDAILETAPRLRTLLGTADQRVIVSSSGFFETARGPLSPDHIVYAKSYAFSGAVTAEGVQAFSATYGYAPKIIAVPGRAVFAADADLKNARGALAVARDAALVQRLTAAFGGPRFLDDRERGFIENWEVESYRKKIAAGEARSLRLRSRVCVVTGAAQGFGLGIAKGLADEGAIVVLADINVEGARKVAETMGAACGPARILAVGVDVSDEPSVARMVAEITRECGGIDVFIANAGVLRAGATQTFDKKDWDLVTAVNYTGYFLCVKHVSRVMTAQSAAGPGPWTDIIQINSKSGLEGSNRNAAYAGGKFGAIGLTQSFAKEFVTDRIKVNSICPGNYFEGPLWSDPERGLFVQYLRAGKVSGATTIADVRRSYEEKVPMNRGCLPEDVVRAILYVVEQPYETGQAVPVTGGQVMLR